MGTRIALSTQWCFLRLNSKKCLRYAQSSRKKETGANGYGTTERRRVRGNTPTTPPISIGTWAILGMEATHLESMTNKRASPEENQHPIMITCDAVDFPAADDWLCVMVLKYL